MYRLLDLKKEVNDVVLLVNKRELGIYFFD